MDGLIPDILTTSEIPNIVPNVKASVHLGPTTERYFADNGMQERLRLNNFPLICIYLILSLSLLPFSSLLLSLRN